ncbi:hypothetical protein OAQ99_02435 [Candidatus Kapabacteria bacterium]|nr:hypothetical protein [Candidatus Kapabacteria bacterium]
MIRIIMYLFSSIFLLGQSFVKIDINPYFPDGEIRMDSLILEYQKPNFDYLDWKEDLIDITFLLSVSIDTNGIVKKNNVYPLIEDSYFNGDEDSKIWNRLDSDLTESVFYWKFKKFLYFDGRESKSYQLKLLLLVRFWNSCHHDINNYIYSIGWPY